jgi:hypothetical protein
MGDLHDLAGTDRLSRAHALGLRLGSEVQAAAGDAEGGH